MGSGGTTLEMKGQLGEWRDNMGSFNVMLYSVVKCVGSYICMKKLGAHISRLNSLQRNAVIEF